MNKMLCLFIAMPLFMSGCAMDFKEKIDATDKKVEDIYLRLGSLESKMDTADQRLSDLERNYNELTRKKEEASLGSPKGAMATLDMQTALKNAGFYKGSLDGKIGPNFESALKEFQKANGLKVDGVAGAKTRALLAKELLKE